MSHQHLPLKAGPPHRLPIHRPSMLEIVIVAGAVLAAAMIGFATSGGVPI
jgi:hypothetical protein